MTSIKCLETGLVYRNPKPYLRSLHAYHPSLVVIDAQEIIVTFDLASASQSLDYHTVLSRSLDGGKSWHLQGPVLDKPCERPTTHSVRTRRLADGTLVGFGALVYREESEEGVLNNETLGFAPMDLILTRSLDKGHRWTAPEIIRPSLASPAWEICHNIVELPDGRWLAPTATWRGWNGENPAGEQAVALISKDRGKTWPSFVRTFDGRDSGFIHWEQSVVPLKDGRLLAVAWIHDPASGKNLPTPYTLSSDDGRTFDSPRPTGFLGQTCKAIQLRDQRILCVYRRADQPGLWATLSQLDGDKWTNLAEQVLWQGAASGMDGRLNSGEELANLKFGFPGLAQMPDGDMFIVFWCVEDCVSNIRWLRINLEKD